MNTTIIASTPEAITEALRPFLASLAPAIPIEAIKLERIKRKETLTTEEVEMLYGLNANTLRSRRVKGEGPAYIKDGASVLYTHMSVKKYLDSCKVRTYND